MSEGCQPARIGRPGLGLRPRHFEILAAPTAGHAARPARQRLPLPAARAHRVATVAALGVAHGVPWLGDHAPPAGRPLDDLQKRGRDLEQAASDLQHRLERVEPRDAVPGPAAELHVQIGPQPGPHPSHRLTSVRLAPHCFAKETLCVKPPHTPLTLEAATFGGVFTSYLSKTGGRRPTTLRPGCGATRLAHAPEVDPWFSRSSNPGEGPAAGDCSASVSRRSRSIPR